MRARISSPTLKPHPLASSLATTKQLTSTTKRTLVPGCKYCVPRDHEPTPRPRVRCEHPLHLKQLPPGHPWQQPTKSQPSKQVHHHTRPPLSNNTQPPSAPASLPSPASTSVLSARALRPASTHLGDYHLVGPFDLMWDQVHPIKGVLLAGLGGFNGAVFLHVFVALTLQRPAHCGRYSSKLPEA